MCHEISLGIYQNFFKSHMTSWRKNSNFHKVSCVTNVLNMNIQEVNHLLTSFLTHR